MRHGTKRSRELACEKVIVQSELLQGLQVFDFGVYAATEHVVAQVQSGQVGEMVQAPRNGAMKNIEVKTQVQ